MYLTKHNDCALGCVGVGQAADRTWLWWGKMREG